MIYFIIWLAGLFFFVGVFSAYPVSDSSIIAVVIIWPIFIPLVLILKLGEKIGKYFYEN